MSMKQVQDFYPLSPMQQGMLFHTLYAPETGVLVEQVACTLRGSLDISAFERAWQRVIERQSILRTAFVSASLKDPVQVVHRSVDVPLVQHDWSDLAPTEQESRLTAFMIEDQRRGFKLNEPPLLRLTLVRTAADAHRFVWTYHHILFDGWSLPLLLQEVLTFYAAFAQGRDITMPPPRPFRNYIAWLHKQSLADAEAFWRRMLAGFTSPTPLLDDHRLAGPHGEQGEHYNEVHAYLSPISTARLQALARQHRLTLNTIVQGAWALLLSRYSGEDDVVFGATVSGRPPNLPGAEQMIGLFINTLPVRIRLSSSSTIVSWLQRLQAEQAELRQYEYSSLLQVQGWSDLPRGVPLFETMLVFENFPVSAVRGQDGQIAVEDINSAELASANYPLTLVAEPGEQMRLRLVYDCDRFACDAVERMSGHLCTLLEQFAANPLQSLATVDLLSSAERQRMLVEWNATAAPFPADRCMHELVAEQVARTPDALAVIYGERSLSYAELDARANQLARRLQACGVGPDTLVALWLSPGFELVIAVLGVLKAGGAYLPLDPAYPAERLRFMLEDARPAVLLTTRAVDDGRLTSASTDPVWQTIYLDHDWPAIAQELVTPPVTLVTPTNLAYCIYTSGSTGKPKGTLLEHRGLSNLGTVLIDTFAVRSDSRVLQFAAFGFDASVTEIFMALLAGATLVLANRDQLTSPPDLLRLLRDHAITTLTLPPSLLAVLPADDLPALQTVASAGEACSWEVAERWARGRRFLNGYGPTEVTVAASYYQVGARVDATRTVPIGRPNANTQLYVLDNRQRPVPVGVPGEIYIGGAGLARAYLGRPALTAERFVFLALDAATPARLYRSGDLARFLPDGNLEFLGRVDHQVKLRGFRIELGEIEASLRLHPAVQDVAVIMREDQPGNQRLVAYLTLKPGQPSLSATALREHLAPHLPAYMLPAAFVMLESLPLSPSGKVDRRSLPAPEGSDARAGHVIAPRTAEEELLTVIWAQVLGVERISISDNFFELGGHSLLATQVVTRVREALQIDLPLRAIFETATLADLADLARTMHLAAQGLSIPPISVVSRDGELPLSYAQQRLWFLDQLEPGSPLYNIPIAVRLEGVLDIELLEQAIQQMVQRHEILRVAITTVQGRPQLTISDTLPVMLSVSDLSHLPADVREQQVRRMAVEEVLHPFDLARPPLLRGRVLRLAPEQHVALFTMHHIVTDGWSMGVLIRELAVLYGALLHQRPAPLLPLSVQYLDYAAWQRGWLQGDILEQQLSYWRQQLRGAPPLLELPTDRPRPAVQSFDGAQLPLSIPGPLATKLRALSRKENASLFTGLLAAFSLLLSRLSGQDDISVGSPIANRTHSEIELLIGFFVNTLVLRNNVAGELTFRQLLKQVRETALAAYAHQDVPFEMVVDALQPERTMSFSPLFQVMFLLQYTPALSEGLTDLRVSTLDAFSGTAKFDLTLELADLPDEIAGVFEYNTGLFDQATIARMRDHFLILLEAIVANPDQAMSQLPLLTEAQRYALTEGRNCVQPFPVEQTLHGWFAAQVARTPDHIALNLAGELGQQLSYRELNERANRFAHHLRRIGVGPEQLVALRLERSLDMVVAILAVLKAGGAYLPIDLAYPQERVAFMLEDARPVALITQRLAETADNAALIGALGGPELPVIRIDTDWDAIARESPDTLDSGATPDSLAYVIYTSGSTGKPKGCMLTHRNVVRLFTATEPWYGFNEHDVWTLFHSYAFDFSVWEIWGALLYGGRLVVLPYWLSRSPEQFHALLRAEQVTVLNQTPSAFRQLIHAEEVTGVADQLALRYVIFGGEALEFQSLRPWFERHGDQCPQLVNMYGITETTVHVTYRPVSRADLVETTGSAIGVPIPDLTLFVLDQHHAPVPVGVPGELYVGGAGVARGYLNRPELTAERFIEVGTLGRLYKTGDRARLLPNADLEYLGRIDEQVKLRGFRIELDEIVALLQQHPQVREAAVILREDRPGQQRLVAYVVPRLPANSSGLTPADVRAHLAAYLPDYMLPAAFVTLERLPLTTNGKLDRRALPAPRSSGVSSSSAPQTPAEIALTQIWMHMLGVTSVGRDDSFFALGGDSILSIQAIAQYAQAGWHLTARQFFQNPTLAALAAQAVPVEACGPQPSQDDYGPAPLTPIQYWYFAHNTTAPHHWNSSIMLTVPAGLDQDTLERAFQAVVDRHPSLRLRFSYQNGTWTQQVLPTLTIALERIDLAQLPGRQRAAAITAEATRLQQSLDLTNGPLVRIAHFTLGPRRNGRMLIIFHHLVTDGVSLRIVFDDLIQAYQQLTLDGSANLPPATAPFLHWARTLNELAQSPAIKADLPLWLALAHQPPPALPVDYPWGDNTYGDAERLVESLDSATTRALLTDLPVALGVPTQAILLTALARTLQRWSGASAFSVDLDTHGRSADLDLDVSRTVGWFTNVYPLRLDLGHSSDPFAGIQSVQRSLAAVPAGGLSYGLLRYCCADPAVREAMERIPRPQINFNYLGQFGQGRDRADEAAPMPGQPGLLRRLRSAVMKDHDPAGLTFGIAPESVGVEQYPVTPRDAEIYVVAIITDGELDVQWSYSARRYKEATIKRLARQFLDELRAMTKQVKAAAVGQLS